MTINQKLNFCKLHACGNDFLITDSIANNADYNFETLETDSTVLASLADRHYGIGWDQALIVHPPRDPAYDFAVSIFNADGSRAANCINGLRSVFAYVCETKLWSAAKKAQMQVIDSQGETTAVVSLERDSNDSQDTDWCVKATMQYDFSTPTPEMRYADLSGTFVDLGNPHFVSIADKVISHEELVSYGSVAQTAKPFPNGVNLSILHKVKNAQTSDTAIYQVAVYERGAGPTLACGSAALAIGIAHAQAVQSAADASHENRLQLLFPGGILNVQTDLQQGAVTVNSALSVVFWGMVRH